MTETKLLCLLLFLGYSSTKTLNPEKEQFCKEVEQCQTDDGEVCGIRSDGQRHLFRIFMDECELMKFGCEVENDKDAYGIIKMDYCNETLIQSKYDSNNLTNKEIMITQSCIQDCPEQINNNTLCGIREHGEGYKLRLFVNECEIMKYNCEKNFTFNITDHFLCDGLVLPKNTLNTSLEFNSKTNDENLVTSDNGTEVTASNGTKVLFGDNEVQLQKTTNNTNAVKKIIVVDSSMFDNGGDINDTVENFFAATHIFDMPLKDVSKTLNESTRRVMVGVFGPVMVYKPAVVIPKNVKEDVWHRPTLSSCYHECPKKCPDTYEPVCGTPGTSAREPSLMFQNHCFMDAAQCKMRWDNESYTSQISSYLEASFVFCLGDALNGLYRFLPLVRTLQHMGRLKKKGKYRIRLRNMRFFNELLTFRPKVMG